MQMQMQMQMQMRMMMMMGQQPGAKPPKPPRRTFPAAGDSVRMELTREGSTIRFQVVDAKSAQPRYLGQVELGPNDVMAVKLFATNRNGAEPLNVLLRDLTIRADRINGLGTSVRTVFDEVIYADPTSIENGVLIVGGTPKAPPVKLAPGTLPADVFASGNDMKTASTPPGGVAQAATTPAATPVPKWPPWPPPSHLSRSRTQWLALWWSSAPTAGGAGR